MAQKISNIRIPTLLQWGISSGILVLSTFIGYLFHSLNFTGANTITVYILGALLTALFTRNNLCCVAFSLTSVLLFNFFFTEPRLSLYAYESGYPVTFVIMLIASILTGTLANRLSENTKQAARAAYLAKNEQLRANLLRAISHDLRTPLTAITGNAENLLLNRAVLDEDTQSAILRDIHEDSLWLVQLVENMLAITRIGEGKTHLNITAQLVEEVVEEALSHVGKRNQNHILKTDIPEELLLAKMDARLISQVIVNLVDNALKYTPPCSEITVSARKLDNMVQIQVADNGPGIPDKQKNQVFEMFYTGSSQVVDCRRSLGLGLALCRSIVEAHGGEIHLTDNQPQGCIFAFTLPESEVPEYA